MVSHCFLLKEITEHLVLSALHSSFRSRKVTTPRASTAEQALSANAYTTVVRRLPDNN